MSDVFGVTRALAVTTRARPAKTVPDLSSISPSKSAGLMTAIEFGSRLRRAWLRNFTRALESSSVRSESPWKSSIAILEGFQSAVSL